MAQITTGIRSILSASFAYDFLQNLLGARRSRKKLVKEYIRPMPGDTILDVGCGTCAILEFIPRDVQYIGLDLSSQYIETVQSKYAGRGQFHCLDVADVSASALPQTDIALALGLLHHLEDEQVLNLFRAIALRLTPAGRLVTIDPCYYAGQSRIARLLISHDRGRNVRTAPEYADLARSAFSRVDVIVRHDLSRIPYTQAILECHK